MDAFTDILPEVYIHIGFNKNCLIFSTVGDACFWEGWWLRYKIRLRSLLLCIQTQEKEKNR